MLEVLMLKDIIVGTIAALVLAIVGTAFRYRNYLKIAINCFTFSRNKKIRVSMASILSIRRENFFILVRNHHRPQTFGPIGGVYKYYPSAIEHLDKCGFQPQIRDQDMQNDLRGFLLGKNLPSFLEWFFSGKNREIESLSREIKEELQEIQLSIKPDSISDLQYDLNKTIIEGLSEVQGMDYLQFRYFGVYSLCAGNSKCDRLTERLFDEVGKNPNIIAVTADEIIKRISRSGEIIGGQAGYLIGDTIIWQPTPHYPEHL
ncbi:MAG: hypothetical protein IH589_14020 [Anaerolineales bacterium]|nr:hypothetical protein [Anaerolineales bacterium]